ncbi:MAG: hypothetical protein IPI77_16610 [Saprospiraceae bacterium]|nr:hypothetical protein [Saprospiraceae bacterium]
MDKLNQLESNSWDIAKRKNIIEEYKAYLLNFPAGLHSDEANKRIVDLEVDNIFKNDHGILPAMERISSGYSSSAISEIEIFNNTDYTLTVRYSGLESKKIEIKSKNREKLILKNGQYRITASVSAFNVSNYAGEEKLEGGEYGSEYYIITQTGLKLEKE